jgi:hypothetical protein
MDEPTVHRAIDIKIEGIRTQMEHVRIRYEYEIKLKEAKYNYDRRKLELALAKLQNS